jgi:pimeloyl-ACP methyl ester carboxylesterase
MAYWEAGDKTANPVVFLHGNPTSKYLWRNIIPRVSTVARCLAPDLIGMGDSGPSSSGNYRFVDHAAHLDAWFEALELRENGHVTLVGHDWGSGLGFYWAHRHPDAMHAIVHMESIVATVKSWDQFPEAARKIFQGMRSPSGEEMILEKNVFIEKILPASIMRKLSDIEMDNYRKPFAEAGEKRRPTLTWPREIPIESEGPKDVVDIVNAYRSWLAEDKSLPKLYIHGVPGFFSEGIKHVTRKWSNQQTVEVRGLHFLQEDSPGLITDAIVNFLKSIK